MEEKRLANGNRARVRLSGRNGNVFNLIGLTQRALREAGATIEEAEEFRSEAMRAKSYDGSIQVMMKWADVE